MRRYLFIALLFLLIIGNVKAQPPVISVNVPRSMIAEMQPIFDEFIAQTGIRMSIVSTSNDAFLPPVTDGVEAHLDDFEAYVQSADVVFVNTDATLTMPAIRTRYVLNIAPLIASDADLAFDSDLYETVRNAVTTDGAIPMLPASATVSLLAYQAEAFDLVGLSYPQDGWTIEDVISAASLLESGFALPDTLASKFLLALTSTDLTDPTMNPTSPDFSDALLNDALQQWANSEEDRASSLDGARDALGRDRGLTYGSGTVFDTDIRTRNPIPTATDIASYVDVSGFAVSAGTTNPAIAYELVKFIALDARVPQIVGGVPVWQLQWTSFAETSTLTPEYLDAAQRSLQTTATNSRFVPYLIATLRSGDMLNLSTWQSQAFADLGAATERQRDIIGVENASLAPSESDGITLNFALSNAPDLLPTQALWQDAIDAFIAQDTTVGTINLLTDVRETRWDCATLSDPVINAQSDTLLPLSPLVQADARFDTDNLIVGALDAVTVENTLFGYPLYIEPLVMFYQQSTFESAGIPEPQQGWTFSDFTITLTTLDGVYAPRGNGGVALKMLIAAAGGLPVQSGNTLPVTDFISEASINAIETVLNLARDGDIPYQRLEYISIVPSVDNPLLYSDTLGLFSANLNNQYNYQIVSFPRGSQYTPLSYTTMAGVISNETTYIDACYRWLSYLRENLQVFNAMPAWRSQFVVAGIAQGANAEAFYRAYDEQLQSSNAVLITSSGRIERTIVDYFLFQAFNAYVLDGAALDTVLQDAQVKADTFATCVQAIGDTTQYQTEVIACAVSADDTLRDVFAQ